MRELNQATLDLIREFEGERLTVYRDPVGLPTVGVGHLVLPADRLVVGRRITREQSDRFLRQDLLKAQAAVERISTPLTDNQYGALVSFTFNLGAGGLQKLLRKGTGAIPNRMLLFVFARGKKLRGLIRRRIAERKLYLTP